MTPNEILKKIRNSKNGLGLNEISKRTGLSVRKIIRIENGEVKLTVEDALLLLNAYEYTNNLNILLGDEF